MNRLNKQERKDTYMDYFPEPNNNVDDTYGIR